MHAYFVYFLNYFFLFWLHHLHMEVFQARDGIGATAVTYAISCSYAESLIHCPGLEIEPVLPQRQRGSLNMLHHSGNSCMPVLRL